MRPSSQARDWRAPLGAVSFVVAAITVVGLLLRLASFGDSLFGDELAAYFVVTGHSLGRVLYLMRGHSNELNPPLFFVLAWVSDRLFGDSAQALKLVSLLAGTATIPLIYVLGRRTIGVLAAVVACALAALSPFLIFYSTEARPYALLVLLLLLSTLALLNALETGGRRWWVAYAALSCAAAYTHFTAVFLLVAQFAWAILTHPHARRPLVLANVAAVIGFLPWLPTLIKTEGSPGTKLYAFLEPFTLHNIRIDLGRWSIGHPFVSLATIPGSVAAAMVVAGVALALVGTVLRVWSARRPLAVLRLRPEVALVVVLACAAPVGDALYSSLRGSVWFARNLISSWPGFAVLLAALFTYSRGAWRLAALALALAAFVIGDLELLESSNQRPDYAAAATYIDRTDHQGAPVVVLVEPTPGPPTAIEAALALDGSLRRHPVLRIGLPPLLAVLSAPPYAPLAPLRGEVVAREAATLAGDGTLFVVAPTAATLSRLEALRRRHFRGGAGELDLFNAFLGALPARFRPVAARTFKGFFPVTVYVYRG
jgi:4-amino-4-deoxy-L-arabinose transferase-like glycosyltransferase